MILNLVELLASFLAVMFVVTIHEYAHAYVAVKCGDFTPQINGRLSLNPMRHFDPIGIVIFAITGFAQADPRNGKISDESPVGKALLGHKVGDKVEVETPRGVVTYKVVALENAKA